MTKGPGWLMAVAIIPAACADTPQLIRPDDNTLVLHFGENVTAISNVKVTVPETQDFPAAATYTGHTVTIKLPSGAAAAIRKRTQAHGHSTLYIGSITLSNSTSQSSKPTLESSKPTPQIDNAFLIPDVFTFAPRQVFGSHLLLEVIYAPDEKLLQDRNAYQAQSGKASYKVLAATLHKSTVPPRLDLQLDRTPRNGGAIEVTIQPTGGQPIAAASILNVAAPTASSSDPSGGADIYAALSFTRNAETVPSQPADVYGVDASLHHSFWFGPLTASNNFLFFDPKFSVKAYSKGQDDENTMSLAAPLKLWTLTSRLQPAIESIVIAAAPTYEADKTQHNKNLVADLEFTPLFVDRPIGRGTVARFRFNPFVGAELGHTFHSDLPQLNGAGVERFKTGASAELKFFVKRAMLDTVTVTGSYTYRRLFEPEIFMETTTVQTSAGTLTTAGGTTIALPAGTLIEQVFPTSNAAPRRYLDLILRLGLTPNLCTQIEYSRGELPPAFQRVDKLQAGIAFLFNFSGK